MEFNQLYTGCKFREAFLKCLENPKLSDWGLVIDNFSFTKWRQFHDTWLQSNLRPYGSDPVDHISKILLSNKYRKSSSVKIIDKNFCSVLKNKIFNVVNKNDPVTLVLPGFPFKSGNIAKCHRRTPDIAEIASLCRLWEITQLVQFIYPPGMNIIILSDGIMLSKVFNIYPYFSELYQRKISEWISILGFKSQITIFDLHSLLQKQFPKFENEFACELNVIKRSASSKDLEQLHRSVRLNYNTLHFAQKIVSSYLTNSNFIGSSRVTMRELQQINITTKEKVLEYKAFWTTIERLKIVESLFPNSIRGTPHAFKRDYKLSLYLVNDTTIVLPWMGVGFVKLMGTERQGVITVRYEYEVPIDRAIPIFCMGEESPFGYIAVG